LTRWNYLVSLLREVYIDAYLTSAENYRTLRAEIETPEKAALVYRDFVRKAVRRSVLEWKAFRPELIMAMAAEADIPEADREEVVNYIGNEFRGLHEGQCDSLSVAPGGSHGHQPGMTERNLGKPECSLSKMGKRDRRK
jgi:hypothetical protein